MTEGHSESTGVDITGYTPPLCLWNLVEQHIPPHERDEIKSMLGTCAVEETLDLHTELSAYLEIWRECRELTDMESLQIAQKRLPEPPGMRDRLVQEIQFFVANIKEKAQDCGRDEKSTMKRYNQKVMDYVNQDESRAPSSDLMRPPSIMGKDGRETPVIRLDSPASDRLSSSTYSTLSEDVEGMSDKLNILKLDEVISHLRSYLEEEKEYLVQDLRFLQQCIEEENAIKATEEVTEAPTIAELREERLKLEKDMLSDVFIHQNPLSKKLTSSSKIKPTMCRQRKPVIPHNGPIKAVHLTEPDGIVLTGNVPDSVITKTQQKLLLEAKQHREETHSATKRQSLVGGQLRTNEVVTTVESPIKPGSSTKRPSSAYKFRSMVISNRAGSE